MIIFTPDMWYLLLTCLLAVVQSMMASSAVTAKMGNDWAIGPRDKGPTMTQTAGRLKRAHANLMESLPIFAVLVLMTHLTDEYSDVTMIGATLFFWARVLYVPAYLYPLPMVRTLIWLVSIIGLITMACAIVF